MENYSDSLIERLGGLFDELGETRDLFLLATRLYEWRITREECDIFLRFYKLNVACCTLIENIPGLLEIESCRNMYLVSKRNLKHLDGIILYYFAGEEPIGLD